MLTVKQKLMYSEFKKLYNKIHKKETVFSMSYCKELVKVTVSKIYEIYPDRNVGKITVNWFDKKYNKTAEIDSETYCFEINFQDIYTGIPWVIFRFYKGISKVGVYLYQN